MPSLASTSALDAAWTANVERQTAAADKLANTSTGASASGTTASAGNEAASVGQQFEAMFLRQLLEEFLPKDSEAVFGKGTSGTVWRSMMADSLATSLSKAGTMGIAPLIAKDAQAKAEAK